MPHLPAAHGPSRALSPPVRGPVFVAVALGGAHACLTALWLAGSTLLLDTVGGEIEAWGRERSPAAVVTLGTVLAAKVVVGGSALLFADVRIRGIPRAWYRLASGSRARALGWLSAAALTAYGGVLTLVGLLVHAGVVDAAADADHRALTWHTYFWDPWFLCWGMALAVVMLRTRRGHAEVP